MKIGIILYAAGLMIMTACGSKKELTREEVLRLIQQERQYPKVIDYDIYCGDPQHAKKVLDAGLETTGLVTVERAQKFADAGKPLIHFTDKAQPYFLPTSEKDKAVNVQKVKLADEDLVEVTGIKSETDGKNVVAEYTTGYKNLTPFSALVRTNFKGSSTRKAYFSLYDDGWRLEKKQ